MQKNTVIILFSLMLLLVIPSIVISDVFAFTTTDTLYACDKPNDPGISIHKLDKTDGSIISSVPMEISGISGKVKGCTAISQDPTDGNWYAVIQTGGGGQSGRILATINPETGVGAKIDSLDLAFSTLAFTSDGSLFGVGGAGANVNDVLHSIDKTNALVSDSCLLPPSNTGFNYLVYNWTEDVLYRLAGSGLGSGLPQDIHLDRVNDVTTCDVTTTEISGPLTGELFQASFNTNDQLYYVLARGDGPTPSSYYSLTTTGIATLINSAPFGGEKKGLAFELSLTLPDSDGDGVPDVEDICPGFDDNLDSDSDGIPDGCDSIPIPEVTATPDTGLAPLTVSFTCKSPTSGNIPFSYEWDFGTIVNNPEPSFEQNPFYVYDFPGSFTATCTITDHDGDTNSASIPVNVRIIGVFLEQTGSPIDEENEESAIVTAVMSEASSDDVIVTLSLTGTAIEGLDYTASQTEIIIPAGDLEGEITITAINDNEIEGNESVVIEISDISGAFSNGPQQVTVDIIDDDIISVQDHYLGYETKVAKHHDDDDDDSGDDDDNGRHHDDDDGSSWNYYHNKHDDKIQVTLDDKFAGTVNYDVKKLKMLFNPVDKNNEGISNEDSHLVSYDIKESKGESKFKEIKNILVTNQFGNLTVDIKKIKTLLVPSFKDHFEIPDEPIDAAINHFKCYEAKESKDTPKFVKRNVILADQFGSINMEVYKPKTLCSPVEKTHDDNTSPIVIEDNYLMCYELKEIKGEPKFDKVKVFTNNQFGPEKLEAKKQKQLCVPSTISEPTDPNEPIIITGTVDENLNVGPGQVVIIDGATINGNVRIDGGDVSMINNCEINGNVKSNNGGIVSISSCTVNGNVRTETGSLTITNDSQVTKNVNAKQANFVTITNNNESFGGHLRVENAGTVDITNNNVAQNLRVKDSSHVTIDQNQVGDNLRVLENNQVSITNNHADNNINIKSNTDCTHSANTADNKTNIKDCTEVIT